MKKILIVLGLALFSFSMNAQTKVGTIDADYILAQLPEMTQVNEELKAYGQEMRKDFDSTVTKYQNLVKDYQEKQSEYSETEKKQKEEEIITLESGLKGFNQKLPLMIQMRRNELTKPLFEKINAAMLKVIERDGYTHVLHAGGNSLAFAEEKYDITEKVLTELGITPKK
ncbi:MAG: OmpH family outer membrane protein [Salinimicrobium sp.]